MLKLIFLTSLANEDVLTMPCFNFLDIHTPTRGAILDLSEYDEAILVGISQDFVTIKPKPPILTELEAHSGMTLCQVLSAYLLSEYGFGISDFEEDS